MSFPDIDYNLRERLEEGILKKPKPKRTKGLVPMTPAERQRASRARKKQRLLEAAQRGSSMNSSVPKKAISTGVKRNQDPLKESQSSYDMFYENSTVFVPSATTEEPEEAFDSRRRCPTNEPISYNGHRDQFTAYGDYIAHRLRSCRRDDYEVFIAQHNIDDILFKLSMGSYTRSKSNAKRTNKKINFENQFTLDRETTPGDICEPRIHLANSSMEVNEPKSSSVNSYQKNYELQTTPEESARKSFETEILPIVTKKEFDLQL